MRLIVTGSRTYTDIDRLSSLLANWFMDAIEMHDELEVVHGGASRGADALAHYWVRRSLWLGFPIKEKVFPADWESFGKSAGFLRNTAMVEYGDAVQAFLDPCRKPDCPTTVQHASHGTADTIAKAEAAGLLVKVERSTLWSL